MSRHRTTAAILSFVGMGLGQIYNRQIIKGLLMLFVYAIGLYYVITKLGQALWGLSTLGEQKQHMELVGKLNKMVPGDHSIFLLVQGLIVVFAVILFAVAYLANIRDAYLIGKLRESGVKPNRFAGT
jgi:arabinogalactan oligomer/maltooligosaccharide transport system permease protein